MRFAQHKLHIKNDKNVGGFYLKPFDELDDPRRRWLIQALSTGFFSSGLIGTSALAQSFFGSKPAKLPPGQSIYRITGEATVNGIRATLQTRINPGDTIKTGKNSEIIFIVNNQSMILRSDSHLVIEATQKDEGSLLVKGLRMFAGKILTVSRNTPMQIETPSATMGIRGTGFYVEADPELTYFCTCYGATVIQSTVDPESKTSVIATHHNRPLYIAKNAQQGKHIRNAPFINHTDQELTLIEALVGRTTPFVFSNDAYAAPRRNY
jgi:hypothetical protein